MKKRTLEELNLLDDFLFQELVARGEQGENFCRILLSTILGRKIGKVRVTPQKMILGRDTSMHGIRLDAYIEAMDDETDVEVEPEIYDIEPNQGIEKETLPKRTRYYQGLIDSKLLEPGVGYEKLKNVVIIMILPYDPFGENRMVYTFKTLCVEDVTIPYEDGVKKLFLYTKGIEGSPSQELKEMLKYMENSTLENVTNPNIEAIHDYVQEVKQDREAGIQYMKSWEREEMIRKEGHQKGVRAGVKQINKLNQKLAEAGRTEDIIKAASDREYQEKLLQEFGLSDVTM